MDAISVAVLATLDSKGPEARFLCEALERAGARPCLMDLSLRPHDGMEAKISGHRIAEADGYDWDSLGELDRARAGDRVIAGAIAVIADMLRAGQLQGAIGIGGANGTALACSIMRSLPPLFPKAAVSAVAATAAVQWYVAESDIVMFPSIGDVSLNRITGKVLENAAAAMAAMARTHAARDADAGTPPPLIGVSTFGVTAPCVERVTERLVAGGYEVIHFHASGPGGKALELLARNGELAGVIDVTTHELADLLVDGVYSAGDGRLKSIGVPRVGVPGALDFANFWVGQVPERYRNRDFIQFNAQNILMRMNAGELKALGRSLAERLNESAGPVAMLIPKKGYSENTRRDATDIDGNITGPWARPEADAAFAASLKRHLRHGEVREFDLHVNDAEFADICVDALSALLGRDG